MKNNDFREKLDFYEDFCSLGHVVFRIDITCNMGFSEGKYFRIKLSKGIWGLTGLRKGKV